jgi:putative tricarboxylic transport membrane protein
MVKKVGLGGALFVLAIGLTFFIYSFQYPYGSELGPGPGMLPRWLSGILVLLALAYLYAVIKGKDTSEAWPEKKATLEMGFILGNMALFVISLPIIGFNLAGTLFVFLFLRRNYRWYKALAISVASSVILFLMFTKGFASPMPVNMFGF